MRVCIDTNVLVSYLLAPEADQSPNQVVRAGFGRRFDLWLSETTLQEVARSVRSKPWLASRVDAKRADRFLLQLRRLATIAPDFPDQLPHVTRDPGDDYLIAHSVLARVDFLVTGDKDLLVLGEVAGVRIVSPAAFVAILDQSTE
jgi:hypothetical protein